MEVETPVLGRAGASEPAVENILVPAAQGGAPFYLQSSPEFFMKRLVAAGAGPIYQICKAFRGGESGTLHNPEFTILEWYRPGYDHHQLMDEVDDLVRVLLGGEPATRRRYASLFEEHFDIDVGSVSTTALRDTVDSQSHNGLGASLGRDECLDFLVTQLARHVLGEQRVLVYDYPASQASLARIRPGNPDVAERFELFVNGVEIANGFHELGDDVEQRRRFEAELLERRQGGLEIPALDERLLQALQHGLPNCAGVAVGLDRLLMARCAALNLEQVLAFPLARL